MSLVRVQLPEPHFTTLRKKQFFEGFFQVKTQKQGYMCCEKIYF